MQIATEDAYWVRFGARLRDLPVTSERDDVRTRLIDVARGLGESAGSPSAHADLVHRLGVVLGRQVTPETLVDVRRHNGEERERLMGEGVSDSLLGRSE